MMFLLHEKPRTNLVPRIYSAFKMAAGRYLESGVDPGNEVGHEPGFQDRAPPRETANFISDKK